VTHKRTLQAVISELLQLFSTLSLTLGERSDFSRFYLLNSYELFFIQSVTNAGIKLHHSKIGDYKIDKIIFEIGGKNKTRHQIKNQEKAFLVKVYKF